MTFEKKCRRVLREGLKHLNREKRQEFTCPVCGGVADVALYFGEVTCECHACGAKGKKVTTWQLKL